MDHLNHCPLQLGRVMLAELTSLGHPSTKVRTVPPPESLLPPRQQGQGAHAMASVPLAVASGGR